MNQEIISEILEKADIVDVIQGYVNVIKKGNNYTCICPFHNDTNPSMHINPSKKIFKCFVCNEGGNAISFVKKYENVSYTEAARIVASKVGISSPELNIQERVVDPKIKEELNCLNEAKELYKYLLNTQDGAECRNYLEKRHISSEMISYFELGYASSNPELDIKLLRGKNLSVDVLDEVGILTRANGSFIDFYHGRLIFPIYNTHSEVIGFSGRRIDDHIDPKFLSSKETDVFKKREILYNYQNAKKEASKEKCVYVVEGFMDVFALYNAGIKSCVALLGTAFTPQHAKMLRSLNVEVRLCLDGDSAGQHGCLAAGKILMENNIPYKVVDYGKSTLDPDDILQQYGKDTLYKLTQRLKEGIDFAYSYYLKQYDLKTSSGKSEFSKVISEYIQTLKDNVSKNILVKRLAQDTGLSEKTYQNLLQTTLENKKIDYSLIEQGESLKTSQVKKVQKEIVYLMLTDENAVSCYLKNGAFLIDEVYASIANYIIDMYERTSHVSGIDLISELSLNGEIQNKELIDTITDLLLNDKKHAPYSEETMNDYFTILKKKMAKMSLEDKLNKSLHNQDLTLQEQIKSLEEYQKLNENLKNEKK